ncbi:MAG: glycosyltransferase family 4 protein [Ignavibacteriales bacterium]
MRILQINNNHYRKSGTDSVYLNTIELLRKNHHEVIPFSFEDSQNIIEQESKYFIPKNILSKTFGKFYSFPAKKNIERLIVDKKPDVAHFHNIIGGLSLSILPILQRNKIPTVVTIHGFKYLCPAYVFIDGKGNICEDCKTGKYINCFLNNCAPEGRIKSFALALEAYARDFFIPFTNYIDKYIFLSNFYLQKYSEFYPEIKSKSTFFYNFINEIGTDSGYFEERENYFLFFGRLDREKGIKTLLEAFAKIPTIKLKIIGGGELENYVIENKTDNVEYLGYQNWAELKTFVKKSSFVIIPSECYENNPMTIIESYSLGKPVIGANIGGIPEIIKNEETGFLFQMKNTNDLIQTIQKASEISNDAYETMSKNSLKFAKENFSADIYYEKLIAVYTSLLEKD